MPKVGEDLSREQRLAGQKRLTDKQQAFLDNFMHKDMTQTSAARKAGFGDDDCHYCGFMNIHMMRKLGFENTIKGSWFKRTSNPKVLVIYE